MDSNSGRQSRLPPAAILAIIGTVAPIPGAFAINLLTQGVAANAMVARFEIPYILLAVSIAASGYSSVKLVGKHGIPVEAVRVQRGGQTVLKLVPFWRRGALDALAHVRSGDAGMRGPRTVAIAEAALYDQELRRYQEMARDARSHIRLQLAPLLSSGESELSVAERSVPEEPRRDSAWEALGLAVSDETIRHFLGRHRMSPHVDLPDVGLTADEVICPAGADDQNRIPGDADPGVGEPSGDSAADGADHDGSLDPDNSVGDSSSLAAGNADSWDGQPSDLALPDTAPSDAGLPDVYDSHADAVFDGTLSTAVEAVAAHLPIASLARQVYKDWTAISEGSIDLAAAVSDALETVAVKGAAATVGTIADCVLTAVGLPTFGLLTIIANYASGRALTAQRNKPVQAAYERLQSAIREAKAEAEIQVSRSRNLTRQRAAALWRELDSATRRYPRADSSPAAHEATELLSAATLAHLTMLLRLRERLPGFARSEIEPRLVKSLAADVRAADDKAACNGSIMTVLSAVMMANTRTARAGLGSANADWEGVGLILQAARTASYQEWLAFRDSLKDTVAEGFGSFSSDLVAEGEALKKRLQPQQEKSAAAKRAYDAAVARRDHRK
jgi:hypothetical protein